ncbi:MAG: methyltransferase domain-containing protein [Chloroflexi bacterium]|nr:methyltransferase domain-containing protein [Chloroflexota bacterium]
MENQTKDYFHSQGTVATWWYPERPDYALYTHFVEQLRWVVDQQPWAGQRVLDIGTGKGRFAGSYALNGAQVWGMDISLEMLGLARAQMQEAAADVRLLNGDGEQLPFADACFHVVSCLETIMHVPHPQRLLAEIRRVLRPDGVVVLSFTNRRRLNALLRAPIRLYQRLGWWEPAPQARILWTYTPEECLQLCQEAGLQVVNLQPQGLLQGNARLPLPGGYSLPLFPRAFADWFLTRVEPRLRRSFLRRFMGTLNVVARPQPRAGERV